jgi:dipeptidyl-peptidase-3
VQNSVRTWFEKIDFLQVQHSKLKKKEQFSSCLIGNTEVLYLRALKNQTMKRILSPLLSAFLALTLLASCQSESNQKEMDQSSENVSGQAEGDFQTMTEQFADVKILRYQIPAWDELTLQQKELAYYLTQAGTAGRDMMYDQNYRHNLTIRRALEGIYRTYDGDKSGDDWIAFETYLKRIWFSNGIHHHYSYEKFTPEFDRAYLEGLLEATGSELSKEVMTVIFDPTVDSKKVSKDPNKDLIKASSVNFYDPSLNEADVNAYYAAKKKDKDPKRPISYGLNSKLVKENGVVMEKIWKVGGMYGSALEKVVYWLEKAKGVAETDIQKESLGYLIEYYQTGDLKKWDQYNIAWVQDTVSTVDYINGFVEVYNDPLGYRGSYETVVEIRDLDASKKMKVIAENAQYFENNSSILDEHKKEKVVGISYNFINVVGEAGDASPSTPIGVNLPNADWIRAEFGSKSVSLGNIVSASEKAGTSGFLAEFSHDSTEMALAKKHGKLADKLHTALHEVIGHASGKLNPGIGTPKETLKNYASTLEEGRADLVALYFMLDPKLIEIGVMDDLAAGRHAYDDYIKNGLLTQLRRLEPGDVIEEDHMRNRQLVAAWVFEKGEADNVISKVKRDGKTYFEINDYEKLTVLFGDLLREIQRIKSEGDYESGKALVETYGVQVDQELHQEVLDRTADFNSAPYSGYINPQLVPIMEDGKIVEVRVEYPDNFAAQMLYYADEFTTLPDYN